MEPSKARLTEMGERIREAIAQDADDASVLRRARGELLSRVTTESAARARRSSRILPRVGLAGAAVLASAAAAAVWFCSV